MSDETFPFLHRGDLLLPIHTCSTLSFWQFKLSFKKLYYLAQCKPF